MDKEIKDYKDDSNEEKNTETNEKNDLIDKEIEKESEISNEKLCTSFVIVCCTTFALSIFFSSKSFPI